ncbi:unnamed protein product, partial [Iphiclides podalirius]
MTTRPRTQRSKTDFLASTPATERTIEPNSLPQRDGAPQPSGITGNPTANKDVEASAAPRGVFQAMEQLGRAAPYVIGRGHDPAATRLADTAHLCIDLWPSSLLMRVEERQATQWKTQSSYKLETSNAYRRLQR